MSVSIHGFPSIRFRLPENAICLKRCVNAVWIHATHDVEVMILGESVHLGVFRTAYDPMRPQHRFKNGADQSQRGTIEPVLEEQNVGRMVIQSQIAVGKRDCHPPVIWVLAAKTF